MDRAPGVVHGRIWRAARMDNFERIVIQTNRLDQLVFGRIEIGINRPGQLVFGRISGPNLPLEYAQR
jgi:hypothetical protein